MRTTLVQRPKTKDEILRNLYYSPGKPGSYSGVESFWRAVNSSPYAHRFNKKDVTDFLLRNPAYFLWKPRRKNFPRNKTVAAVTPNHYLAADIWILKKWEDFNDGYAYVLVTCDMFSRLATCTPMKSKDTDAVLEALKNVTDRFEFRVLFTDQEPALTSATAQKFLAERGMRGFTRRQQIAGCRRNENMYAIGDVLVRARRSILYIRSARHQPVGAPDRTYFRSRSATAPGKYILPAPTR